MASPGRSSPFYSDHTDSEDEDEQGPRFIARFRLRPVPGTFRIAFVGPNVAQGETLVTEMNPEYVSSVSHERDATNEEISKDRSKTRDQNSLPRQQNKNSKETPQSDKVVVETRASAEKGRPLKNIDIQKRRAWIQNPWALDSEEFLFPEVEHELQSENPYLPTAEYYTHGQLRLQPGLRYLHRRASTSTVMGMDEMSRTTSYMPMMQLAKTAKEMGLDLASTLEGADNIIGPQYTPCSQCYGEMAANRSTGAYAGDAGYTSRLPKVGPGGVCQTCGTKLVSLGAFGKMVTQLKAVAGEKGLVVHDVYPDGNCQMAAVIDQLHVRGNFRFTVASLRQKAVEFLRNHPKADEETHYEEFVAGEPWESYLTRMSQDRQWGDHLILTAICNVINMRIEVYGGFSGKEKTQLIPSIDNTTEQTADGDSNASSRNTPTIFLGHMGESHYVSLRPKNWKSRLTAENESLLDDRARLAKQTLRVHTFHIDFLVRMMLRLHYLSPAKPNAEVLLELCKRFGHFDYDFVGSVICCMEPVVDTITSSLSNQDIYFSTESNLTNAKKRSILLFHTPTDTIVHNSFEHAKKVDLVMGRNVIGPGNDLFRLYPKKPNLWKGQTAIDSEGREYLLSSSALANYPWPKGTFEGCSRHIVLAFNCNWPECAKEWLRRKPPIEICPENLKETIREQGCRVVPVMDQQALVDITDFHIKPEERVDEGLWCYSFAVAERYLCIKALTSYHRSAFLLFRYMVQDYIEETMSMPLATLKSIFFHTCEHLSLDFWHAHPGQCVMIMMNKLIEGLRARCIPHYFICGFNVLSGVQDEDMDKWQSALSRVVGNFFQHLFWLIDATGLSESEIAVLVEGLLVDCVLYSDDGNIQQSAKETIYQYCSALLGSLYYQSAYRWAFHLIEEAAEMLNLHYTGSHTIPSTLKHLSGFQRDSVRYELALCVDFFINTNLSSDECSGKDVIPFESILGPDLPDRLKGKIAPAEKAIVCGDVRFAVVLLNMLKDCQFQKGDIAKCIRFYVDSYGDIAGDNIVIDNGETEAHVLQYRQSNMLCLYTLYKQLMYIYAELGTTEEYRPLMDVFAVLCNQFGARDTLYWAWQQLGELERCAELNTQDDWRSSDPISSLRQTILRTSR